MNNDFKEKGLRDYFDYVVKHAATSEFRIFFYKTRANSLIILLLGSCKKTDKGYSYEEICSLIPSRLASRTTILSILKDGVSLEYFSKIIDTVDKRKQIYKLNTKQKKKNYFLGKRY